MVIRMQAPFYLNGENSPLGKKAKAPLFWDESSRYIPSDKKGVFRVNGSDKAQPFILQFIQNKDTGKYIISDDLYFELGKYPYPLPSNSMQGMGFCTLTPGEVSTLLKLIKNSSFCIDYSTCENIEKGTDETLFDEKLIDIKDNFINEAQLEFTILASLKPFYDFCQMIIFYVGKYQFPHLSQWIWIGLIFAYIAWKILLKMGQFLM